MQAALEQADHDFLVSLQRVQPATVQRLCEELQVTPTAIRQRLVRVQAMGLVDREIIRHGRGRPLHGYCLTDRGVRQLGDDYAELALLLWREIARIDDEAVRGRVMTQVREALIERFGSKVSGNSMVARIQQLCQALAERGLVAEVDDQASLAGQLPILREHSCPYHELAAEDSTICDLEQSVFAAVLGAPVELSACRLDGHRCCEFQVGIPEN